VEWCVPGQKPTNGTEIDVEKLTSGEASPSSCATRKKLHKSIIIFEVNKQVNIITPDIDMVEILAKISM
jgi:hypothetical protein